MHNVPVPLDQAVRFHFAQIIAELVQAIARGGELEGGQQGVVNLPGRRSFFELASRATHPVPPDTSSKECN